MILPTICKRIANKTKKMKCKFLKNYNTMPFEIYMSRFFNIQIRANEYYKLKVYPTPPSTPPLSPIIIYIGVKSNNHTIRAI